MSILQPGTPEKRQGAWLVRCFIVSFLAVQIGLPLRDLLTHGAFFAKKTKTDFPFTWGMYSGMRTKPRYVATYTSGKQKKLVTQKLVGPFAARVRYGDYLPRLLCEKNPKIVRILRKTQRKRDQFEC